MQWSNDKNGGFSSAQADSLILPALAEGPFGYRTVNVADQQRDPASLLHWIKRLVDLRKSCPEIGIGHGDVGRTDTTSVFSYLYRSGERTIVTLHNMASDPREVSIKEELNGEPRVLLGDPRSRPRDDDPSHAHLDGFGYLWYTVE